MGPKSPNLEVAELGLEPRVPSYFLEFVFVLSLPGRTVQRHVHQAQLSASPARSVSHPAEACLPLPHRLSRPHHGACMDVEYMYEGAVGRALAFQRPRQAALRALAPRKELGGPSVEGGPRTLRGARLVQDPKVGSSGAV